MGKNYKPGELELENILNQAWLARQANFAQNIAFNIPSRTLAVSVTGSKCALNCSHCAGVYLQAMVPLDKALNNNNKQDKEIHSYLVSGGSNHRGRVPLMENLEKLNELAKQGPLNLHTGLVTEDEARKLAEVASAVSFDLVGDDDTIAEVYGLTASVEDYLASYRALQKYTRVVPHLCIGLNRGRFKGEYEALHFLRKEKVEAISMIIFRPTADTLFGNCQPPPPDEVAYFMASARLMFPRTPLYLGCMRPGGQYREVVDVYAVKAGFNKIVLPSPAARKEATMRGLSINTSEECCSL